MGKQRILPAASLAAKHPDLANELHPSKNYPFDAFSLTPGSNRKVWWVGKCGHVWEAVVASRALKQVGCTICANQKVLAGFNDLGTVAPQVAKDWDYEGNSPVTPSDVVAKTNKKFSWLCSKGHHYVTSPGNRITRKASCPFCSGHRVLSGFNDLASRFPELTKHWDLEKNEGVKPSEVAFGSSKKFWWRCERNHSFSMRCNVRASSNDSACPICSHQKLFVGFNDLATTHPEIASQWDFEKNGDLLPTHVFRGSGVEVWWRCPNGRHGSFKQILGQRKSPNCGICLNQTLMVGFNDLTSTDPVLASEWHPTKNLPKTPNDTLSGGRQKIWWLCANGHDWEAAIYSRKTTGCPFCGFKKLWGGFNDLLTQKPDLASEWHPTLNGPLTPSQVMSSVATFAWWRCPVGHDYQQSINVRSRASKSTGAYSGCNICANKVVILGVNHLSDTHPRLWEELIKEGMTEIALAKLHQGSLARVTWRCDQGHEWKAQVGPRASQGHGCPSCAQYGFKPSHPAVFYFLENPTLGARKVGITNQTKRNVRLSGFAYKGWSEILTLRHDDGQRIQALEKEVLAWIRGDLGLPIHLDAKDMGRQGGWTETFSIHGITNQGVVDRIAQVATRIGIEITPATNSMPHE